MADARVEFANQKFHFSGPNALQNAEQFIQEYEISNLQRFIKVKSKGFVKPGRAHLNGRVYWESSSKDLPILFDGCPFVILGHQVRECFNGPDRHRSSKKKGRRNEPGEHTYCVKGRLKIQTTNKMDCPASIHLRSVVRFPSLQIDSNCGSAKRRIGKKLATDLGDEANELPYEHRIYVALPGLDEHRNHLVDEMGCMTHDVHPMIVSKIHALVDDGVRNVGEMKRHITAFSRENFPTVPDTSNRYHPSNKCLRNHMYAALSLSQFSTEDQENLQRHVDIWKLERPDDKFHYIPSPNAESEDADVEDFIFVHQTAWQRRLLSRYGNEICLLDATYKVCKSDVALYFLCVSTNVGYITVGCFLLPAETVHNISRGLRQLNDWNPDWKPSYFMTDYDIKEIKSIETTFPGFHEESYWREPENSQYYHGFQIVKCRECNDQYKEEGDGYFGGHGRRGECNGFYTSASHPGYCGVFCARMSKFEC